ncbi:aquaporin-like protein [Suillus clintonianus]|uniref:aquaporin-like protein n=1 Tax=Suillus clintonianus TaxID=1904413 RepID=UPI001B863D54|nr:aquaporin-like protein [Suillus clintonianus]KAG2132964.1 aquaporin-like protein [Suillus clintonianus]
MSSAASPSRYFNRGVFSTFKLDCKAAALEFVGTTFFLLLGLGGIQAANDEASSSGTTIEHVMYIATSMGFSLLVSAWLFYRITGGLFNPNITLALYLVGVITPVRFVLFCIAQLIGGIAASALLLALTPGPLAVNTFLQQGINPAQGVFIEMFLTAALVMAVLMLAAEKSQVTPFAPIGIGLTLFVGQLWAVFYTGAAMNTARAFGPAVVTGFPSSTHWVYWVGPFLGSLLGTAFYAMLKWMHYQDLNPSQASTHEMDSPDPMAMRPSNTEKRNGDDAGGGSAGGSSAV